MSKSSLEKNLNVGDFVVNTWTSAPYNNSTGIIIKIDGIIPQHYEGNEKPFSPYKIYRVFWFSDGVVTPVVLNALRLLAKS